MSVTTAAEGTVPAARNPALFPVGAFSSHEALTYLMGRLSADPDQRLSAVDLVQDLGGDPLALFQASAAIASSGLTCRDYHDLFAAQQDQLARVSGAQPGAKVVTWMLSVERADQLAPGGAAQSCLALAVLLGGHGIPETVFAAPAAGEFVAGSTGLAPGDHRGPHGALRSLERTGLLTIDPAGGARVVRVHPVVQAVVRMAMPGEVRDQAAQAAAGALLQAWPDDDDAQPPLAEALRSCVASLEQAAGDALWADGSHQVLFRAGQSLDSARLSGPAVAHWQRVASASERTLGTAHPDTLLATGQLASATLAAGLGAEAVVLYQQALDTRLKVLGPDHPGSLAAGRPGRGAAHRGPAVRGDRRPGSGAGRGARRGTRRPERAGHPGHAVRRLPGSRAEPGRDPAVRAHPGRAGEAAGPGPSGHDEYPGQPGPGLPGRRPGQGRDPALPPGARQRTADSRADTGTLSALSALADAYHSARHLEDAIPLYEQVLQDRERIQGRASPGHPGRPRPAGLRVPFGADGQRAGTLRAHPDGLRVLGPSHPDTLAAQANLAHAYYAMGRQADATRLLTGALADCERLLPAGDPLTDAIRDSLDAVSRG